MRAAEVLVGILSSTVIFTPVAAQAGQPDLLAQRETGSRSAEPRTALVGGGQCSDPELVGYLRSFAEKLRPRFGAGMVELNATADRLRPSPRVAAEEIRRQLEAARGQFYAADFRKSEAALEATLRDVVTLPFGDERTKLQSDAWLLRMMLAREQRQTKAAEDAMLQVLRLRPDFKLDPVYFSPSVREEFEQQRRKLKTLPRAELSVKSSPSGAEVFLDGVRMGKTPFKGAVPHGTYKLQVAKGQATSFVRPLAVKAPLQVMVDLDFEGSVRTLPVPCIEEQDDGVLLSKVVRLGSQVEAEQVVVLAVERPSEGPSWLTATLVSVERGQKARQAGFKARGDASAEAALADLAEFIATGQATKNVVVAASGATETTASAPWSPPPSPVTEVKVASMPMNLGALPFQRKVILFAGGGATVVGLAGAGVVRLMAQPQIDELRSRLSAEGNLIAGDARSFELSRSLQLQGAAITGLLVLGVAGAGTAAAALLWPEQKQSVAVGLLPGPDGVALSVGGTF